MPFHKNGSGLFGDDFAKEPRKTLGETLKHFLNCVKKEIISYNGTL